MPTYKNTTNNAIILDDARVVKPGEITQTRIYYNIAGLDKIDNDPRWAPVIISGKYSGNDGGNSGDINIPAGIKHYIVNIQCISGEVDVVFNGLTSYPYKLGSGMGKIWQFIFRYIDTIKLYYKQNGTVCIINIEDLTQ